MRSRRLIKKLMGVGIQRNDARAFVETYHAVKAAGMTQLFRELDHPVEPVTRRVEVNPYRFRTIRTVSYWQLESVGMVDIEKYIEKELAEEIGRGLAGVGAIRNTKRDSMYGVEFCAEVKVLPPDADDRESCGLIEEGRIW